MTGTIKVLGKGISWGTPDHSTLTIDTKTIRKTAEEARVEQGKVFAAVQHEIVKAGVVAEDIQSSEFDFGEHHKRQNNEDVRDGFYASNTAVIRLRNLKSVGRLLDAAAWAGATRITGPNLAIENPRALEDEARNKAFDDAKLKAELYCKRAGLSIVGIESMEEKEVYRSRAVRGGKMAAMYDEADDQEVMVGKIAVEMGCEVVFQTVPEPAQQRQELGYTGQK